MGAFFSAVILCAVAVVFINEVFQQRLGVSPMPTMPRVRRRMLELIPSDTKGAIVEIGCGWGGLALAAAKAHPAVQVTGIEYSPFPFLMSRLRQMLNPSVKNLRFVRQDFFNFPFQDVSVILCYLSNPLMAKLREKLLREMPVNGLVISSTFFIPGWEAEKVERVQGFWSTDIFVYRRKEGVA